MYKMELGGAEGIFSAIGFLILPFVIFYVLLKILPPWDEEAAGEPGSAAAPSPEYS